MAIPTKRMTVEDFDKWVFLPENQDIDYEFIGGDIVAVVSNNYSSKIAFEIGVHVRVFLREQGIKGHMTGADGGYIVGGERYIPDVAYISAERQPQSSRDAYNPNHPDLAIEVVSPSDEERNIRVKIANYLAAGTVVWVIQPDVKQVEVYVAGESVRVLSEDDTLDGTPVLAGFQLKVADIFPEE